MLRECGDARILKGVPRTSRDLAKSGEDSATSAGTISPSVNTPSTIANPSRCRSSRTMLLRPLSRLTGC